MALNVISWTIGIIVIFILVLGFPAWLFVIFPKYKAWKLGNQEAEVRNFPDGTVLIRTEEGIYFMAPNKDAVPLLISEEEGKRLWSQYNGN